MARCEVKCDIYICVEELTISILCNGLRRGLTIHMRKIYGATEIRASIAMSSQKLDHRISAVVTSSGAIRGRMVSDPCLAAVGALKEAIVTGAVVAICA